MKPIVLMFLFLFLWGCTATKFGIFKSAYDKFNPNREYYFTSLFDIKRFSFFGSSGSSWFQLEFSQSNNTHHWFIRTKFYDKDWLFVEKIIFLIDTVGYDFVSNPGSVREVRTMLGEVFVWEENTFTASKAFFEALANTKSVSVRLVGRHYYQQRELSIEDIHNARAFFIYIETTILKRTGDSKL